MVNGLAYLHHTKHKDVLTTTATTTYQHSHTVPHTKTVHKPTICTFIYQKVRRVSAFISGALTVALTRHLSACNECVVLYKKSCINKIVKYQYCSYYVALPHRFHD